MVFAPLAGLGLRHHRPNLSARAATTFGCLSRENPGAQTPFTGLIEYRSLAYHASQHDVRLSVLTRSPMQPETTDQGLLATTRYLPRLRLERSEVLAQHRWMAPGLRALAKGQRCMASWDEDSVTMAVEAARQVQQACPGAPAAELTLASTTLPFSDRLSCAMWDRAHVLR
jgi:hypothetical protein